MVKCNCYCNECKGYSCEGCNVCGSKDFTEILNKKVCNKCGAVYLDSEIVDFKENLLIDYFTAKLESKKDLDNENKEFIKGLFTGYLETLLNSKWKKAKSWAVLRIIDLIKNMEGRE